MARFAISLTVTKSYEAQCNTEASSEDELLINNWLSITFWWEWMFWQRKCPISMHIIKKYIDSSLGPSCHNAYTRLQLLFAHAYAFWCTHWVPRHSQHSMRTPMHIHEQLSKHVICTKTKNLMSQSYVHLVLVNFPTFFTSKLAHLTYFEWQAVVYTLWQEGPKLVYAFWTLQPVDQWHLKWSVCNQ